MIYGDPLEDNHNIIIPDYLAIKQSANLYVYCLNSSLLLQDSTGELVEYVIGMAIAFITMGGIVSVLPGMPSGNQRQNEQVDKAVKEYSLSKEGRRLLHDTIHNENYTYQEVMEEAKAISEMGGKYVK